MDSGGGTVNHSGLLGQKKLVTGNARGTFEQGSDPEDVTQLAECLPCSRPWCFRNLVGAIPTSESLGIRSSRTAWDK